MSINKKQLTRNNLKLGLENVITNLTMQFYLSTKKIIKGTRDTHKKAHYKVTNIEKKCKQLLVLHN